MYKTGCFQWICLMHPALCVSPATVNHELPCHHTYRHDGIWHGQWKFGSLGQHRYLYGILVIIPLLCIPASTNGLSGDDESSHHDVLPACDEASQPLWLRVQRSGERRRATPAADFSFFPFSCSNCVLCVCVTKQNCGSLCSF